MSEVNEDGRHYSLREVAALVEARVVGDSECIVSGVASIEDAEAGDIVFAESARYVEAALRSAAAAILLSAEPPVADKPCLVVADPRSAFVRVLEAFAVPVQQAEGIHASAVVHPDARIGHGARIGPYSSVDAGAVLEAGVTLAAGVRVGQGCIVGEHSMLYPNVVLYPGVTVGRRCILHAGCVVGSDGFGYVQVGQALRKVPHLAGVKLGDDVEIGANTCIDRGKTAETVIGSGTKIDNLVHIAHNVHVGRSSLLVAQVGIAGSTVIGDGVVLAGQVGVRDHVTIGDGVRVGGQGGVIGDLDAGQVYSGYPARPHHQKMREYGAIAQLPDYLRRIRAIEKRLAAMEQALMSAEANRQGTDEGTRRCGVEGDEL